MITSLQFEENPAQLLLLLCVYCEELDHLIHLHLCLIFSDHLCFRYKICHPDSAMVPSVCRPHRDETEIHLAHLPVHRILWRTGSDKGDDPVYYVLYVCCGVIMKITALTSPPRAALQLPRLPHGQFHTCEQ